MLFNAFLALALRTLLAWENKKLDAKYGVVGSGRRVGKDGVEKVMTSDDVAAEATLGSENDGPNYRYIL